MLARKEDTKVRRVIVKAKVLEETGTKQIDNHHQEEETDINSPQFGCCQMTGR